MNIPGFTADAGLYQSSGKYVSSVVSLSGGGVVPQAPFSLRSLVCAAWAVACAGLEPSDPAAATVCWINFGRYCIQGQA
jgi:hypothetical protein